MRRLVMPLLFAVAAVLAAPAHGSPTFVFSGHGWGHAIGMAQYGSEGFAREGLTYDRILAHYYQGTQLGPAPVSSIRVLLASGRRVVQISSDSAFTVKDAQGYSAKLAPGTIELGADLVLTGNGQSQQLAAPVRFLPGGSPLRLGDRSYRGRLIVSPAAGDLQVVNRVPLEKYLYGVVPGEMPADWHPEALKVQAVAARSYALVSRKTGGAFDVYADTRSQVYGGIAVEHERTTAAVNATKGQVVLFDGKVAWTFFSSSSGGRTASIEDVWPDSEPLPYLVSVDDPHDTISPHHDWNVTLTAEQLEQKLGSAGLKGITEIQIEPNGSGRAGSVTFVGATGEKTLSGWATRILLGLRSTWFQVEALTLERSAARIVYGETVKLHGTSPSRRVTIEVREKGGDWSVLQRVRVRGGAFSFTHEPAGTTFYRARATGESTPSVRVAVAPKITLRLMKGRPALLGRLDPARRGVEIVIQRRSAGKGWTTVAIAKSRAEGTFRTALALRPGRYRAWVEPAGDLVAGTSPAVAVRPR
jgi:stage II sporulation protein D